MKKTILKFLIGLPVAVGVAVLYEYLYSAVITHSPFVFDIKICLGAVLLWLILVIVLRVVQNRKNG